MLLLEVCFEQIRRYIEYSQKHVTRISISPIHLIAAAGLTSGIEQKLATWLSLLGFFIMPRVVVATLVGLHTFELSLYNQSRTESDGDEVSCRSCVSDVRTGSEFYHHYHIFDTLHVFMCALFGF